MPLAELKDIQIDSLGSVGVNTLKGEIHMWSEEKPQQDNICDWNK